MANTLLWSQKLCFESYVSFRLAWFWLGKVNAQVRSTCDVCDNVTCVMDDVEAGALTVFFNAVMAQFFLCSIVTPCCVSVCLSSINQFKR